MVAETRVCGDDWAVYASVSLLAGRGLTTMLDRAGVLWMGLNKTPLDELRIESGLVETVSILRKEVGVEVLYVCVLPGDMQSMLPR